MGEILKLVAIRCADTERSVAFYQQLLGRVFVEERHGKGPRHYAIVLNGTAFELYPRKGSEPIDKDTRIGLAVENVDFRVDLMRALGTEVLREPADSPWGRRAVVSDPDGRSVEVYDLHADGAIPLGQQYIASRIADVVRHIIQRPEMYVGSRSETVALGSVLASVLHIWADAAGQEKAFFDAILQLSQEEDGDSKSYEMIYRERHPDATDEEVFEFILNCWRRIMTRLGILETPTSPPAES